MIETKLVSFINIDDLAKEEKTEEIQYWNKVEKIVNRAPSNNLSEKSSTETKNRMEELEEDDEFEEDVFGHGFSLG